MPYIIKHSGAFEDTELGIYEKRWPQLDEDGRVLILRSRKEAQAVIDRLVSPYEGIAYYNILSHSQLSGSPAVAVWVPEDKQNWPRWARDAQ